MSQIKYDKDNNFWIIGFLYDFAIMQILNNNELIGLRLIGKSPW